MHCQTVLSTFYTPTSTSPLWEGTIRTFRHPVSRYARRFFFLLVSHGSLETAYRLAIDLNSPDLFIDLYHCALEKDNVTMAHLCAERARQAGASRGQVAVVSDDIDSLAVVQRDLDEISESEDEDDSKQEKKPNPIRFDRFGKSEPRFKVYNEQDLEGFARKVLEDNIFLYDLKLDSF